MRRTLGTVGLLLALAGCADDGGSVVSDPPPTATPTPSPAGEVTQVALLTGSSAGGEVTTEPTVLPDRAAVVAYAEQFRNVELQRAIMATAARTDVPDGQQLAAAVVSVGCEVPTEVTGTAQGDQVTLQVELPPSEKECFAPITSVAMVLVPA